MGVDADDVVGVSGKRAALNLGESVSNYLQPGEQPLYIVLQNSKLRLARQEMFEKTTPAGL